MEASTRDRSRLALEFLRLSAISGLVFITVVVLLLFIVGWVYRESIKGLFVEAINKQLRTEMYVDDMRLDMFRSFPLASLTLHGVTLMESGSKQPKDTLLRAGRMQFQFRLFDILRKDYTLKQITISKGFARIGYHAEGYSNFDFWNREVADQEEALHIDLQRVVLSNFDIRYFNVPRHMFVDLAVSKAILGGLFADSSFRLKANAELLARELIIDSMQVLAMKPVKLDLVMVVEDQAMFHFQKGQITIAKHVFSLEGSLSETAEGFWFDTRLQASSLSLRELIDDLPDPLARYLSDYRARGELSFLANISGASTHQAYPSLDMVFSLESGELLHRRSGLQLRDLAFSGTFDNGRKHNRETATLRLDSLFFRLNDGMIRGGGSISNLVQPYLDMKLYADINALDMVHLFRLDTISSATGRLFMDVAFQGGMSTRNKFSGEDLVKARASGVISASGLGFTLRNNPLVYHDLNGSLLFRNNDLMIESFSGNIGRSDFAISGYFRNVLPYLFLPGESIQVDASMHARRLDFDELLQDHASEADTTYRLRFSDRLGFHLEVSVDELNFRRFAATNISGNVSLHNKRFFAQDVTFRSMEGLVQANGYIDGTRSELLQTGFHADLHRVDVHQLFYQMGNFGQTGIIDENIFGIITSGFRFTANWTPALQIDWGSLETDARIRIDDGVLVDYQPMHALGRFLRVDDLSRVTFSTLENLIHIKDRKINIPQMEINSNVLNIKLSGEHTFENQIDYYMQVLLSDILANKNRERRNPQEQYGEIQDDGLGRTTLFLKVTGHIDDPEFRYDYQGVRQKLRDDLIQEREDLRDALRREFPFLIRQPKDTTDTMSRSRRQREMDRIRKQEEGKIIIEWDDI
jgi:hypothetical protein